MLQHFQPLLHRLFTPVESKKVGGVPSGGVFLPFTLCFFYFLTLPSVPFSAVKRFPSGDLPPLYTPRNCDVVMFYNEVNINII